LPAYLIFGAHWFKNGDKQSHRSKKQFLVENKITIMIRRLSALPGRFAKNNSPISWSDGGKLIRNQTQNRPSILGKQSIGGHTRAIGLIASSGRKIGYRIWFESTRHVGGLG
jgi:hypothetical protein